MDPGGWDLSSILDLTPPPTRAPLISFAHNFLTCLPPTGTGSAWATSWCPVKNKPVEHSSAAQAALKTRVTDEAKIRLDFPLGKCKVVVRIRFKEWHGIMVVLVHSMSPTNEGQQVVEWAQHSHPPSRAMKMEPMMKPKATGQPYLLQVLRSQLFLQAARPCQDPLRRFKQLVSFLIQQHR